MVDIVDLGGEVYQVVPEPRLGMLRAGIVALAILARRRRLSTGYKNKAF